MPITDKAIATFQSAVQAALQPRAAAASSLLAPLVTLVPCGVDDFDYEVGRSSPPFTATFGSSALRRTLAVDREPMVDLRHTLIANDGVMSSAIAADHPAIELIERAVHRQVQDAIDVLLDDSVVTVTLTANDVEARLTALTGGRSAALVWFGHPAKAVTDAAVAGGVTSIDASASYEPGDIPVFGGLRLAAGLFVHDGPAVFRYEARPLEATVWRTASFDQAQLSLDERRGLRRGPAVTVVPYVL